MLRRAVSIQKSRQNHYFLARERTIIRYLIYYSDVYRNACARLLIQYVDAGERVTANMTDTGEEPP